MNHTDLLFSFALNKLTADRERLNSLLEEQKGTDIGRFMERALEWRTEASKRQLLWELLRHLINLPSRHLLWLILSIFVFVLNFHNMPSQNLLIVFLSLLLLIS